VNYFLANYSILGKISLPPPPTPKKGILVNLIYFIEQRYTKEGLLLVELLLPKSLMIMLVVFIKKRLMKSEYFLFKIKKIFQEINHIISVS